MLFAFESGTGDSRVVLATPGFGVQTLVGTDGLSGIHTFTTGLLLFETMVSEIRQTYRHLKRQRRKACVVASGQAWLRQSSLALALKPGRIRDVTASNQRSIR